MLERLFRTTSSTEAGPQGIIDAVYGNRSVSDITEAVMGVPDLRDFGGEYVSDYQIVIPLFVDADVTLAPFLFDLPEEPELSGALGELAGFYGVESIDEIGSLHGKSVPIEWPEGYPQPALNVLREEANRQ